MMLTPYFLLSDILYFVLVLSALFAGFYFRKSRFIQQINSTLLTTKGLAAFIIICFYFFVASLDSIHFYVNKAFLVLPEGKLFQY